MNSVLAAPAPSRLGELAALLACSDEQFDQSFRQAQQQSSREPFSIFSSGASTLTGSRLFELGLKHAWLEGWLGSLLRQLIIDKLDGGRLWELLLGSNDGGGPSSAATGGAAHNQRETGMVATQRNVRGWGRRGEPDRLIRGSAGAICYCGQVLIDDAPEGSGFLIGPDLFLTAWHVVSALLAPVDGLHKEIVGSAKSLKVVFNNVRRWTGNGIELQLPPGKIRVVGVAERWLICGAPGPIPIDQMPAADKFAEDWDYAVIRLAEPIGGECAPARIGPHSLPSPGGRLWIFQYPRGMPLKYDAHDFLGVYGTDKQRFYYKVETDDGSSGGPCLDDDFRVVGMHLASWLKGEKATIGDQQVNLGVPIEKLHAHLQKTAAKLAPDPATAALRRLGDGTHPVVGRWDFQLMVWNELLTGEQRRVVIVPDDQSPGRGKSFLGQILESMLARPAHLVAVIPAELLAKATVQAAHKLILTKLGAAEREITRPSLSNAMPLLRTTAAALPRDNLVPEFVRLTDDARGARIVWIIIDDLDRHQIVGETSQYLYLLYQQAAAIPWLRFLLIGFRGDTPALGPAQAYLARYPSSGFLAPLSTEDVKQHLAWLVAERGAVWTQEQIDARAGAIVAEAGNPFEPGFAGVIAAEALEVELELLGIKGASHG